MATKNPATYLKFHGGPTEQKVTFRGASIGDSTGTQSVVITMFMRILEWPNTSAMLWEIGTDDFADTRQFGMFLYSDEFAKSSTNGRFETGDDKCLGLRWQTTAGATLHSLAPMTTDGIPPKLGALYQVQYVLAYDSGSAVTRLAIFVDGTSTFQTSQSGFIDTVTPNQDADFQWGGDPRLNFDGNGSGDFDSERAIWELHQFMIEVDRDVTITGGNIDPPDGLLDPAEELMFDKTADPDQSAVWHIDDDSGTTVTRSAGAGSANGTITGSIEWADSTKVDPDLSVADTATYHFENTKNYSIRHSDSPDASLFPVFAPSSVGATGSELRLRPLPTIWNDHGRLRTDTDEDWIGAGNVTGEETTQIAFGEESLKTQNTGAASNVQGDINGYDTTYSDGDGRWYLGWFYDGGGTGAVTAQRFTLFSGSVENTIGVQVSQSETEYFTRCDSGGQDPTGVTRSVGWHEVALYSQHGVVLDEQARFYLDGKQVREEIAASAGGNATIPGMRHRSNAATEAESAYWAWLRFNRASSTSPDDFEGLVAPATTIVLPLLQPSGGVTSFDDVTITDEAAGTNSQEVGTLAYNFRHSTDGGGSYGASTALTDANLAALTTAGNGQDVLEISITLTPGMDQMSSPAVRQLDISWSETPGWTEETSSAETWTEETSTADSWTEETSTADTWAEESSSAETWSEETSTAQSWTEES